MGTILRIDTEQPAQGAPYAIPADNPFVGESGARGEVWAYGLRNPWRFSFDGKTGDLWVGDVGQNALEEVNIVYPGVNYGWNVMEGTPSVSAPRRADRDNLQAPVAEYGHSLGCSITGGYVYRGQRVRELEGVYLYADFCSGRIWGLRHDGAAVTAQAELVKAPFQISSFGEDAVGELYVAWIRRRYLHFRHRARRGAADTRHRRSPPRPRALPPSARRQRLYQHPRPHSWRGPRARPP